MIMFFVALLDRYLIRSAAGSFPRPISRAQLRRALILGSLALMVHSGPSASSHPARSRSRIFSQVPSSDTRNDLHQPQGQDLGDTPLSDTPLSPPRPGDLGLA